MQITLTTDDVSKAPADVKAWLIGAMIGTDTEAAEIKIETAMTKADTPTNGKPANGKAAKPTAEKTEPPAEPITEKELIDKALAFMQAKGEDVFKEILARHGLTRTKGCPENKRAALLAEIAIHA